MGKAADNERIKLTATYFNNLAVGLFVAGSAVPYFVFFARFAEIVATFRKTGQPTSGWPLLAAFVGMIAAFLLALLFRHVADLEIQKLED